MSEPYIIGNTYTRKNIYDILNIPENKRGGDWLNGYHRHGNDYYIFCNIGTPGRTGHDYKNRWENGKLIWYGKNQSHFGQKSIQDLISDEYRVLIFYRETDRSPFIYAGTGTPIPHKNTSHPVRIDWILNKTT